MSDTNHALTRVSQQPGTAPAARAGFRAGGLQSGPDRADQGKGLQLILLTLRRWWAIVVPVGLLLAAVAGTATYFLLAPSYRAEAMLRIRSNLPYVVFPTREERALQQQFVETQVELIRSPYILGLIAKRAEISDMRELEGAKDPVLWLAKHIDVIPVAGSELFTVAFECANPQLAAVVCNAAAQEYFNFRHDDVDNRRLAVLKLLQVEEDRWEKEVRILRTKVLTLAKENAGKGTTVVDPLEDSARNRQIIGTTLLTSLLTRLSQLQVTEKVLKAEIEVLRDSMATPRNVPEWAVTKDVAEDEEVARLTAMLTEKQVQLDAFTQRSARGEDDPHYAVLQADIDRHLETLDAVKNKVAESLRGSASASIGFQREQELAGLESQLRKTVFQKDVLREEYEKEAEQAVAGSDDTWELQFAQQDLFEANEIFRLVDERMIQLEVEAAAFDRVSLLKEAEPPILPVQSHALPGVIVAAMITFCCPLALAVGWEGANRRITDGEELERDVQLNVLGEIACMPRHIELNAGSGSKRFKQARRIYDESIDSLGTCLRLSSQLSRLRVLMITSAINDEGKTSVAVQLALSLSRASGQRALLIDADMRSPNIHTLFGVPRGPGLAEILAGECMPEEAIVTSCSRRVHLLPAGILNDSPHTLLGGDHMESLLIEISPAYGYVIIDSPPVLAASEALALAKAADATLVSTMLYRSRGKQVKKACERLAGVSNHLAGIVINGVPPKQYTSRYGIYPQSRD